MKSKVNTPNPNHLAIYIRVSTDKQVDSGISLSDQKNRGINKANELSWTYEVFEDAGLSGELSYKDRPALFSLMEKLEDKKIGGFWSVDIDRWSRSNEGFLILSKCKELKIRVFENTEEKNLEDSAVMLMMNIKQSFAIYEVEKTTERIKRALLKNAKDKKAGGGPLTNYGYKKDPNNYLIIDEKEAEIVKTIFKMSLEGAGTKKIANWLNENNIPTKRASALKGQMMVRGQKKTTFVWRDAVVYALLTNTIYKGLRNFNDLKIEAPIIIEPPLFNLVQENLKTKNKFKETNRKYFYLLKGLIKCGGSKPDTDEFCNGTFYGKKREDLKDNQYTCISGRHKAEFCGTRGINIDYLDGLVWTQIQDLSRQLNQFFNWYEDTEQIKLVNAELFKIRKKEKKAEEETTNLMQYALSGTIPQEIFDQTMNKLTGELQVAKDRKGQLLKQLHLLDEKEIILNVLNEYLEVARKENITDLEKQRVLRALIDCVYITWNANSSRHFIMIEYKIDKITQFKLSKDIEISYSQSGWRLNKTGLFKNELLIRQVYGEDMFEGAIPSRAHVTFKN